MKLIALSDIIITERFLNNPPKEKKLNKIRRYYSEFGVVDKPIIINKKNVLIDGYIRYLVLKENGREHTYVKVQNWLI